MIGVFNGQFLIIKIRFPHLLSIIYRFFCSRRDVTLISFGQIFWHFLHNVFDHYTQTKFELRYSFDGSKVMPLN